MTKQIEIFLWFIGLLAIAGFFYAVYDAGYDSADTKWQQTWDREVAKQAIDRTANERIERDKEQEWQRRIDEVEQNAQRKIDEVTGDIVAAELAADSLREQAATLAKRASQTCNSPNTPPGSKATASAEMVFADVLARIDERAGELAEAYDKARNAGVTCELAYESVRF